MKTLVSTSNKKVIITTITFDEHEIREALMVHFAYELQDYACLGGPVLELYEGCYEDTEYSQEAMTQFAEFTYVKEKYVVDFM